MNDVAQNYSAILKSELQPALGCTEPIALAFAGAHMKKVLGGMPEKVHIAVSSNVLKNAKSVTIPNSQGMIGIPAAVFLGICGGDSSKGLEVLTDATEEDVEATKAHIRKKEHTLKVLKDVEGLYIEVKGFLPPDEALVVIKGAHTQISRIEKNGETVYEWHPETENNSEDLYPSLNVKDILEYARGPMDEEVLEVLEKQIMYNDTISKEGLKHPWGISVGAHLYGSSDNLASRAAGRTAAGSDARMGGCTLPVVINSGSGNQGLCVSLPVMEYAAQFEKTHEQLLRALLVSNLISIRVKYGMGKLSAFCGAVSATTGAAAGIAFLMNENEEVINNTIINCLGNLSGVICDGAKASCAFKIASSVQAAVTAYQLASKGSSFLPGEGIISEDIEKTIDNITHLGLVGMRQTDKEIVDLMGIV